MGIEAIEKLFPALSELQKKQFAALPALYAEWNAQINLISRKDMDHFMEHHVLHSLALGLYWQPAKGEKVIDIGTGGGFPGIPLAILFPEVSFLLVDSIGKKIMVVQAVADALGLTNVRAAKARAEDVNEKFDTAVSRAVARLTSLADYCSTGRMRARRLYCLKGGDLREEVEESDRFPSIVYNLSNKLSGEFFETKKVVMIQFK